MLDAMLSHDRMDGGTDDAQLVIQRAEYVRQPARLCIKDQQRVDTGRTSFVAATWSSSQDTGRWYGRPFAATAQARNY